MTEPAIRYRIEAARPSSHLFEVTVEIADPDPAGQRFLMPAWIPGSYLVRDFARHVVSFSATCGDETLLTHKVDKSTWRVAACDGSLIVKYTIFAYDLSVRGAHLDTMHGYFNGACVFVAVVGREHDPVSVDIVRPAAGDAAGWQVATTLETAGAEDWGYGRYRAADYDDLIDHPVEMGRFDVIEFEASGTPHALVLCGRHRASAKRLQLDLTRICEQHAALFGELPDMRRYLFLVRVLGEGYGGLEHRSSSSLICKRDELPRKAQGMDKAYRRFLGLASHEYFHLWNIKRIKPAAFTPYDLRSESHTGLLWVFEGITSYYDDLALVRSGAIDSKNYFDLLAGNISRIYATPGRYEQSLAEASFDAWTKFYKPTANSPNAGISYYAKGALIALTLDLTIRSRTSGKMSLDDCMRRLWQDYGKAGIGLPEDGFEDLASHVTGLDLTMFFDTYIRGTDDPPLEGLLSDMGITTKWCRQNDDATVTLGAKFEADSRVVATVLAGGPAESAGLAPGDELIAVDRLKIQARDVGSMLRDYQPGDSVTLHAFRRDELLVAEAELAEDSTTRCKLTVNKDATEQQNARRRVWLGGGR